MRGEDPRLAEAKALAMTGVIDRIGIAGLKPMGGELIGPCPLCGGKDRFGINLRSNKFLCRICGIKGGDQIALVRAIMGLSFADALTWLCGDAPSVIDPAEQARRQERARAETARQDQIAASMRARARADAKKIWTVAKWSDTGIVRDYLAHRGIVLAQVPKVLRLIPDHPCVRRLDGQLVTLHRGPAMIGLVQEADGHGCAVHQTWIDLAQPNGRAKITHLGEAMPAKILRGSKKGGAIRLFTPDAGGTLVMGEGIETTLTALAADAVPGAAYWAGVDLGNMSGPMQRVEGTRYSGLPEMDDAAAFLPPVWVRRLIFIQDGDSAPAMTRAKLEAGLRRAMAHRPGLLAQIVRAGDGVDLNDLVMPEGPR